MEIEAEKGWKMYKRKTLYVNHTPFPSLSQLGSGWTQGVRIILERPGKVKSGPSCDSRWTEIVITKGFHLFLVSPLLPSSSANQWTLRTFHPFQTYAFFVFLCLVFIYLAVPGLSCGMWDIVPRSGIEPGPPTFGVWSLSHWTPQGSPNSWATWWLGAPALYAVEHLRVAYIWPSVPVVLWCMWFLHIHGFNQPQAVQCGSAYYWEQSAYKWTHTVRICFLRVYCILFLNCIMLTGHLLVFYLCVFSASL